MSIGQGSLHHHASRLSELLDAFLRRLVAFGLPLLVAAFSLVALFAWPSEHQSGGGEALAFHALESAGAPWTPQDALARLQAQPTQHQWDSHLREGPTWFLTALPDQPGLALEFPSRHTTAMSCWDAGNLNPLGTITRSEQTGGLTFSKAGFVLALPAGTRQVLCEARFLGPARFTAVLSTPQAVRTSEQQFQRHSGLLEGGMLVLAAFILIAGLVNRDSQYFVFAIWMVVNLRMAALSAGWDYQWLGHTIPYSWLVHLRPLTLALYYSVTVVLFHTLFYETLREINRHRLVEWIQWTTLPLLALSVWLPYGQFLPIIWLCTGVGVAVFLYILYALMVQTESRVARWYVASIALALISSAYEIVAAALGFKGLIGAVNSVTAALLSALLTSLAIAERMREENRKRLDAQAQLEHTYDVIPVGLFTLDTDGRFLSANPALRQMLGEEVLQAGTDLWSVLFSPEDWQQLAARAKEGGSVEMEMALAGDHGEPRRMLVRAAFSHGLLEGTLQDITEKAQALEHLQFLANHDPLTRVLNRRGLESNLTHGLREIRLDQPLTVAYLDLDRFKLINDLYGHTAGDEVLQQVCMRVQHALMPKMQFGRIGGDEFLIVMHNTPLMQAETVCREVLIALTRTSYAVGNRAFNVRGSLGLIEVRADMSPKDIVSTADRACRDAKKSHGGGLTVYEKGSHVFTEHEAELQLVERLATNQSIDGLFLEMQPIMSLKNPHSSLNFEVLLRMQDEHGDRVPTDRLISAGENAGRMGVIDRWVLTNTLEWLHTHNADLSQNQFVCLNLSGASLNDEIFIEDVFKLLDANRDIARKLCLEITESVALHDMGNTRRFIDRIRSFGAKVALDDFGAGYTSFSYLKDLPADLLKIDGSFIVNMNRHPANVAIVEAIVSLAQNLGMKTVAEWAEDFETVVTLAEIGVDYVQGFVVARPQNPQRLLQHTSSASFIQDASLNSYLGQINEGEDDALSGVDLVLGQPLDRPSDPSAH